MNNLVIIVSLCLLHVAVHCIPLNEASQGGFTPQDRHLSSTDLNKEKLELLKKQIEDLGKSLDKLSQTYRPPQDSVEGTYNEDGVMSGIPQPTIGDEINVDVKDGTGIQTLEGDISQNSKLNSMSTEQLELLEKILSERLGNEKRVNQEEAFDPMAQTNVVNSKDLLPAPPKGNTELPERGDSLGRFAGRPFAPEELGAVKDLQEDENTAGNEETATEVSDAEKKSECSSMVCLGTVDPVCGTDDKNYANECKLTVAACKNKDLKIRHKGECKTVADVLITALMLDIQLLLDNGVDFDEIHKLVEQKRNDIISKSETGSIANAEQRLNYLVSKARQNNEPDYTERPHNGIVMM
ncbi:uncharacterized protein LOC117122644 [Anneissia japonica]|uniref:uncharacterized protein LOC117122644 n=1 Tax=Anneissia japonica TaxID=1529436 RepID=UPI001425574F|nr:uncharacterized protein LOC117122644 [Anneissia japonica]